MVDESLRGQAHAALDLFDTLVDEIGHVPTDVDRADRDREKQVALVTNQPYFDSVLHHDDEARLAALHAHVLTLRMHLDELRGVPDDSANPLLVGKE